MRNGWTGGQYSLFRAVFALYLLPNFLSLSPWNEVGPLSQVVAKGHDPFALTAVLTVVRGSGIVLCLLFGLGFHDRVAALGLAFLWAWLFGIDPFLAPHGLAFTSWLLLAHLFVPPAPYGSLAARGRVDPGGGWRMPPGLFAAVWFLFALAYTCLGFLKLASPSWRAGHALTGSHGLPHLADWTALALELAFAPLALLSRIRPWLWLTMLLMQLTVIPLNGFTLQSMSLVMPLLFLFDPGWIRPLSRGTEMLFYDGHCGLCQRSVRLILAEDATGSAFRFAPLQGETFASLLTANERETLPLSLVVRMEKGTLLTRSSAVLHIMRRLGGFWRLLAGVLILLPATLRDRLYNGVARIRHRIFAQPAEVCPLMPLALRARFDP